MIELIVLDVDGCLTDGSIIYTQNGDEIKSFDVKDGLAIASWIRMGKSAAIITGRNSKIVQRRAEELGIRQLHQGVKDKHQKLMQILKEENLTLENIAVIGDDLNDYHILQSAKRSFTPNDGVPYIKKSVQTILSHKGGNRAVREMIEILVEEEGLDEEYLAQWV